MKPEYKKTDQEIKKEVGLNIKRIRRSLRKFQSADDVAKKLGISRAALTQIENGHNNVNAVTLWKLARTFGCEVQNFLPAIPKGYQLSKNDFKRIAQKDERAAQWAIDLFGEPINEG